jgi:sulfatase-like protein
MLKDAAAALSLANLCYIAVWSRVIARSLSPRAQWARYNFNDYPAVLINVIALALIFWIAITLARRSKSGWAIEFARAVFLFALIVVINGLVQTQFPALAASGPQVLLGSNAMLAATAVVGGMALILLIRFRQVIVRSAAAVVLVMFPFVLITVSQAVWLMTKFEDKTSAPLSQASGAGNRRIVWLVFDEADQRLAFAERPATLKLPEFDRLRSESLFATNAYPPANQTLLSMPALINGRLVSEAYPVNPSELMIRYGESQQEVRWSEEPNVFSLAQEAGYNTALIGWYHPYCRVIGKHLTRCFCRNVNAEPLSRNLMKQVRTLIHTVPYLSGVTVLPENEVGRVKRFLDFYGTMLEDVKQAASDPSLGLVLAHWCLPHPPVIYNRHTGEFKWDNTSNYLDNLALADRAFGEVRRAMESAGVWDTTTVLVTSDHSLRRKNWSDSAANWTPEDAAALMARQDDRIPFVLKLAGEKEARTYNPQFNTVLSSELFMALLAGKLSSSQSVVNWLDQNRSLGESPYKRNRKTTRR